MVLLILHFLYRQALDLLKDLAILSLLDLHDIQLMDPFFPWGPTDPFHPVSCSGPISPGPSCGPSVPCSIHQGAPGSSGSLSLPVTPSRPPQPFGDSQHIDVPVHVINNLL